jgi:hypothetical protein
MAKSTLTRTCPKIISSDEETRLTSNNRDNANFINFCSGKTLTNGLQGKQGSCNGIVMGDIPAVTQMVSTVILNPSGADTLTPNQSFNITVKIANMALGSFTNATSTYYSAPQQLDGSGVIIGHTHVTVQDVGSSLTPTEPLDAQTFVFFKGINDAGNGAGTLTTAVTGGLPAGNYRVCTLSGASNHQPVIMPVAQRGAQDDCRYFSVAGGGGNSGSNNAASTAGAANNAGAVASSATSSAAAAATSAATGGNTGKKSGGRGGRGGKSVTTTSAAAAAATSAATTSNAATAGALAGVAAPAVVDSGDSTRPFSVNGDTFVNKAAAVQRACAIQNNGCANAVNSGKANGVTVTQCNAQEQACNAAGGA